MDEREFQSLIARSPAVLLGRVEMPGQRSPCGDRTQRGCAWSPDRSQCAIMRRRRSPAGWAAVVGLSVVCLVSVAQAQPSADEVLANTGLTAADKQSVLSGQFVNVSVGAVSERDLSFAIVFLVKKAPEELAKKLIAGELITSDAQGKA